MVEVVYDSIVIGGGPGGSTAGTTLAKVGPSVLLLEKEQFPRFHPRLKKIALFGPFSGVQVSEGAAGGDTVIVASGEQVGSG